MSLLSTLVELGFSQQEAQEYCDLFRSHDITQNELMSLDHELLKEMGVTKIGHRIRLLKLKQMRDSLPTSYQTEEVPKKTPTAAGRKKKVVEPESPPEPVEPKPKPKRTTRKAALIAKAKLEDNTSLPEVKEATKEKPEEYQPVVPTPVEPVEERPKPKFTLFDLPEDLIFGSSNSPKTPRQASIPYSLDEGFSLEIPSSFSKAMQDMPAIQPTPTPTSAPIPAPTNTTNNTNVKQEEPTKTEKQEKQKKREKEEKEEKPAKERKKEKEKKKSSEAKKKLVYKETPQPIVPSDEEDSEEEEEASEQSLEEYINDEVMQIDPEEASALDFVLQNEADQEQSTGDHNGDAFEEVDDYMTILNDKVTKSLEGLNVKDIMKGTPNKLKQIVIDSFIDITPRKHQWEAVYNIIRDILMSNYVSELDGKTDTSPPIKNYLIQHSAGSGKSLTIACLVYMLYMLKDDNDKYKFDFILVLTDRKVLDEQLGKTVKKFLRANQVRTGVKQAGKATDLNSLLVDNTKSRVLMSTVQKFGQLLTKNKLDKTIAIIADEAHRTHGRSSTRHVHEFLTGATRQSESITYFSFTCTPTPKALEMFGVKHGSTYSPFCTYSMEQALNDKVIMNVLEDYTSVAAIAQIEPSAMEAITKTYEKGLEATKTLMKATEDDRQVLREKAKYIVNHFVKKSKELSNDKFTAKGMLVTGSRKHIIWYKQEIETLIRALPEQDQFEVVAAFTSFTYEGKKVTQDDEAVNGDYAGKVLQQFKKNNSLVKLIIVADKLRTGFDEPKLAIMYIDRKLMGTNAVQTLGRLNRVAPGKEAVSVVDFVNSRKQISEAFGQYWATTTLVDMSGRDPLQKKLDDVALKLLSIEGVREKDLKKSVNAIIMEDFERKKQGARTVERELNSFTNMCDRLQMEHSDLPYKFAVDLKQALFVEYKSRLTKAREILSDISLRVDGLRLVNQGSIHVTNSGKDLRYNAVGAKVGEISEPSMNVGQIVNSVNEANFIRLLQMKDNPKGMAIPLSVAVEEDFSNDNLEFAKGIWSRRQRPRSVSDMRKSKAAAEVPMSNTTAEEEKKLARDLESELLTMSNKVSNTNNNNPVKQLVPPATSSSFQIKKLLQQQNPRENFKPKIAGESHKSAPSNTNTNNNNNVKDNSDSAPSSKPASPALLPQPAPVPTNPVKEEHVPMEIDTPSVSAPKAVSPLSVDLAALIAKNCPPSPAKRKIDQVDENKSTSGGEPSEEPERKKQKLEPEPKSPKQKKEPEPEPKTPPPVIDLSTPPEPASEEPNEDPMEDHDGAQATSSSHEEKSASRSGAASPTRTTNFTELDKAKISAFMRMIETTKYNAKDRQKVLRALAGHAITDEAKNYMREIGAINLLIKEFLVPLTPNSELGAAIYKSIEDTACASTCLYELARGNRKNAELIADKALGHIIGMLAQKSDLQISSTKLLAMLCVTDTLKQRIGAQSIPTLIWLLDVPDEVVKHETTRTLRIMCTLPVNAQLLAESGGVPSLVNLMGAKQVNTCVMAIKALHDLCTAYPTAIALVKAEKLIYRYMPKWLKSDVPKYKAKAIALDNVLRLSNADYNTARKKWPELNAPLRRSNEPSSTNTANLTRSWENKTEPTPPTNVSELPQVVSVVRPVIITPPKVKAQSRTTPGSVNPLSKSAEGLRVIVANQPPSNKSLSKSSRGPPPSRGPSSHDYSSRGPPPSRGPSSHDYSSRGKPPSRGPSPYSSRGPPPFRGRGSPPRGPPSSLRHSTGSARDYYRGPSPNRSRPRYRRSRSRSRSRSPMRSRSPDRRSGPPRTRSRSRDRYRRSRSRSRGRSRSWSRSRSRSRSRDRNRYSRSRSRSPVRSPRDKVRSRDRK